MTNPFKRLWRWVRREALIEAMAHDLDFARKTHGLANDARKEAERKLKASDEMLQELVRQRDALKAEPAKLRDELITVREELIAARLKLNAYLADVPAADTEIEWTKDDQQQLADFLENKPAGKKLAVHLANRLGDYQAAAITLAPPNTAYALCARARGFRDCRGELLRLSAAGPSPANHVAPDMALPDDLENLRA